MRTTREEENVGHHIHPLGDTAIMVTFGTSIDISIHNRVQMFKTYLDEHPFKGMIEYVPAFTSVTVYYDPVRVLKGENQDRTEKISSAYEIIYSRMEQILHCLEKSKGTQSRTIEIPVCYGGEFGPDIEFVAKYNNLSTEEVIQIHSSGEYLVYMIGFAPGFPYLGGMSEQIAAPRKSKPRMTIEKGSVGIAGEQTGVYSISTPGGWQLIGRTPLEFFRVKEHPPSLLNAGDTIRFKAITNSDFLDYKGEYQ